MLAEETACVERTGAALLEAETARSSEAITVVRAQGAGSWEWGGGHEKRKGDERKLFLGDNTPIDR